MSGFVVKIMKAAQWMRLPFIGLLAVTVAACASIGRPEGGPRDETPPEFVRSNPSPGATDVNRSRVEFVFNENLKLDDVGNKLVISPPQKQNPSVSANGRRITVELRDTLRDSTTYTFDFSDAIRDLNEGNVLDGFAMDFSTGPTIDSLRISGMLFEARNLEPAQGMVVGVYNADEFTDTTFTTLPLDRVAKTNQYGQFTIRGLKEGTYRVFAINDRNRDWHWDRSEDVAFSSFTVTPSVEPVEVLDTLLASDGTDSIAPRIAWHYMPDDLLLTWFNENYRSQYLREYERTDARRVTFKFGALSDSLPDITIINGPRKDSKLLDLSVLEAREGLDSLVYWMRDTALVNQDSLLVSARYLRTDSLDRLSYTTDTLKLFLRGAKKNRPEKKKKKEDSDTLPPPVTLLNWKALSGSSQELNLPARFEAAEPVESIDSAGWRLEIQQDTLWIPVPGVHLKQDTAMVRQYVLDVKWQPGAKYRFSADSLSIRSIYGEWIKDFKHEFVVKLPEDYGNIIFGVTDYASVPDSAAVVVQLLDSSDKPVMTKTLDGKGEVVFDYVNPGTYYARAFADRNHNGIWDTGNVADSIQPEDVFYYPKKLSLRKNWDIDQEWSLYSTPVDQQKPNDIKKNRPKTRDRDTQPTDEEEEEEGEYGDGYYGGEDTWGNGSRYNNSRNNSGRTSGRGGLQQSRGY